MSSAEAELKKVRPQIEKLCDFLLLGKKIEVLGKKNIVQEGPNIIVGNHCGTFKDGATIFKIVPRPIFFTANKMIFNKDELTALVREHFQLHMKSFGYFLNLALHPIISRLINFVTTVLPNAGTIPVDLTRRKKLAIEKCQEYLRKGRAIIALQGNGKIVKNHPNPYISPFRKGPSILSYNLYTEENIPVAVTPLAFFGTQSPVFIPGRIRVNIGEPMFIADYMANDFVASVEKFRAAMERRVKDLFLELIRA
jgi:1-acyl-sn-glycerol-3-phosphate acyltransferase